MIPPFGIEGGLPLALARALSVAGLAASAGSLAYTRLLRPPGLPGPLALHLRRLGMATLCFAIAGALVWLIAETQDMAGSVLPASIWAVLSGTLFGHLLAARLALLGLAALALSRRLDLAACLPAIVALLLQAGHSHALAMGGAPILLASSALHLLAAGIWLGGLIPLWLVVGHAPPGTAQLAAKRFSLAGLACVAILIATARWQFSRLVMTLPGLVGTAYGWTIGVKIALFAALLALAARNRFRLTPHLATLPARQALRRAILLESALGLAVLAAAGVLSELQPAMHTQKLWPFPWAPSLDAAREDPDVAREALWAAAAITASLGVLLCAALLRRHRRLALPCGLAAVIATCIALPHLSPLLVPAVPTEFYRSPTGFTALSITQGASLYPARCAACHGASGRGDGLLARTLAVPPADLTAPHLWMHTDGQLFWWLNHGIEGPRGGLVMPGFAGLSDNGIWSLIDFIRARNAGNTLGPHGWTTQLMAPDFAIACPEGPLHLSALRGAIVQLLLPAPNDPGHITLPAGTPPRPCHADDTAIAAAYAVAAPGARSLLIDANGWLRAASPLAETLNPMLAAKPLPPVRAKMDMNMDPGMKM